MNRAAEAAIAPAPGPSGARRKIMQNTFSTTKANVLKSLGEPKSRKAYGNGKEKIEWACGCSFDETDANGSGILFACEKHAG
jgi:hypothetical protein